MAKMRVVIYVCSEDDGKLDDAEKQCHEHADRFGWQVLEVIRHKSETGDLSRLVLKANTLRAQIIVTGNLAMLSPDQGVRDKFMEAIERQRCIVHPVSLRRSIPVQPEPDPGEGEASGRVPRRQWTKVIDGRRLREVREKRGLSQQGLATLSGVGVRTVARLDREDRPVCQGWTLGRIAAALGEEPAVFFISDKK